MPKHAGDNKKGRNEQKCKLYRLRKTCERHKAKRIQQSNGFGPALAYTRSHGLPDPIRKTN